MKYSVTIPLVIRLEVEAENEDEAREFAKLEVNGKNLQVIGGVDNSTMKVFPIDEQETVPCEWTSQRWRIRKILREFLKGNE